MYGCVSSVHDLNFDLVLTRYTLSFVNEEFDSRIKRQEENRETHTRFDGLFCFPHYFVSREWINFNLLFLRLRDSESFESQENYSRVEVNHPK